jgi:hypothetical protein
MSDGFEAHGLVEYYGTFVPQHFRKSDGTPVGRRQAQMIAKENNLPLIRLGGSVFIDVAKAAERLREAQLTNRTIVRKPGRPKVG